MNINIIVLENAVFIDKYHTRSLDSRTTSLSQLNNKDTKGNRKTKFVRCWLEIEEGLFAELNELESAKLHIEQDKCLPWFNKENALIRAKEAFKEWHKEHVLIDQEMIDRFIRTIADLPIDMITSMQIEAVENEKALDFVKTKISFMDQQKIDEIRKANYWDTIIMKKILRY